MLTACRSGDVVTPSVEEPPKPVTQNVFIYLVDLEGQQQSTGKEIGCGDRLAPVKRIVITDDNSIPAAIIAALNELFAFPKDDTESSAYYTVFDQSTLQAKEAVIIDRVAHVALEGTVALGGVCDTPRFFEQIDATIRQFSAIQNVEITLNGSAEEYTKIGDMR